MCNAKLVSIGFICHQLKFVLGLFCSHVEVLVILVICIRKGRKRTSINDVDVVKVTMYYRNRLDIFDFFCPLFLFVFGMVERFFQIS